MEVAMHRCLGLIAALLLSIVPAWAAEDAVLLASTAPGYGQGMVVTASDKLNLPDGASITLLLRSGQVLRLRGPLTTSLDRAMGPAQPAGSAVALAEALRLRGIDASAIGGTRNTLAVTRRAAPQDVTVDVQRSGTYCIGATDPIWLVQPRAESSEIALRHRGNLRRLAWPRDASRIEWPADVPVEDGDRFELIVEGRARAMLTFRTMAAGNAMDAATIASGILLGCRDQYEVALRRLARGLVPPDLWLDSGRGRDPHYRRGETVMLSVLANTDGWLYCVTRRSDGVARPIFPAGAIDGARWPRAAAVTGSRYGLAFEAGPSGEEQIRCWLADRDISAELPHGLMADTSGRLPDRVAEDLDAIFNGIAATRVVAATLAIRVE
jgi:hypothetical protein